MLVFMDAMEWKHLPVAGGMYDQHPDFVEKAKEYMGRKSAAEREKQKQEQNKKPRARANQGVPRRR
jgi:hypothetical protein